MRTQDMDPILFQTLLSAVTGNSQQQQQNHQQFQMLLASFATANAMVPPPNGVKPLPTLPDKDKLQQLLVLSQHQHNLMQQNAMTSPTLPPISPYLPFPSLLTTPTTTPINQFTDNTADARLVALSQLLNGGMVKQAATSPIIVPPPPPVAPQQPNFTLEQILRLAQSQSLELTTKSSPPVTSRPESLPACLPIMRKTSSQTPMQDMLSMMCPPPVLTPNGSLTASSPSTSSKTAEKDEEGDDSDLFVDIESVDVAIDGKDRRKAHVEFYRKMKSMRQKEKVLSCALCKQKVENAENVIQTHISTHADAGGYQCRICGWQSNDKYLIYAHMRKDHPRKVDMFADKRDMPKMCTTLGLCFPKTTARPKKESDRSSDGYLDVMLSCLIGKPEQLGCAICKSVVKKEKHIIIRHVQTNHTIKCKTCKFITATIEEQQIHQRDEHQETDTKLSVHYAPSAAAVYLLPMLEKCFPVAHHNN